MGWGEKDSWELLSHFLSSPVLGAKVLLPFEFFMSSIKANLKSFSSDEHMEVIIAKTGQKN